MSPDDKLALPDTVVTKADVARLIRDFDEYSQAVYMAELRDSQPPSVNYISPELQELLHDNQDSLHTDQARHELLDRLRLFQRTASQIHVSFAAPPSIKVVQQLVTWFRQNVQPDIVMQIGVDPSIIGGCVVRTTNKVFSFSIVDRLRLAEPTLQKEVAAL